MQKKAKVRHSRNPQQRFIPTDRSGKVPGGSQLFPDPTHGISVVVQMEYPNLFSVSFMSENEELQRRPKSFTREELTKMIAQAQGRLVEIIIHGVAGYIKAICLKKFLAGCPRSI